MIPVIGTLIDNMGFPGGSYGKESSWNAGGWVQSLGQEDTLEKEMATHSSILTRHAMSIFHIITYKASGWV